MSTDKKARDRAIFPEEGAILLWRRIFAHRYWNDGKPYTPLKAWIDCLRRASWAPHDRYYHGHLIHLERGQFVTSQPELAHDWRWGRSSVRRFLSRAQTEHEATIEATNWGTMITIVGLTSSPRGGPAAGPCFRPAKGQRKASERPAIEEGEEGGKEGKEETTQLPRGDSVGSGSYPAEGVGRVFEAHKKATGQIRPPYPWEQERIKEVIAANAGDWRPIAAFVGDVTAAAVRDGKPVKWVSYGLVAWENRDGEWASGARQGHDVPRDRVPSPPYHGAAEVDRRSVAGDESKHGAELVGQLLRRLRLPRKPKEE